MFTFQCAAPSTDASAASAAATAPPCAPFIGVEPYKSLFLKWGFLHSGEWNMHVYRYGCTTAAAAAAPSQSTTTAATPPSSSSSLPVSEVVKSAAGAASVPTVAASALRFHHGLAAEFLRCLFASPCVRAALAVAHDGDGSRATATAAAATGQVEFHPLSVRWNTLEPLRHALVDAKVVRQVACEVESASPETAAASMTYRLPAVKRAEELLPHGEVISDEVRALFLRAHQRLGALGRDGDDGEEEDEDDDDMWGSMSGARLPLRQLRGVFGEASRQELLYHVLWRLIAGSGPLNQFEDDAAVYLDAARELYRALVTSVHVKEAVQRDGEAPAVAVSSDVAPRYEAVVDASVYEVAAVPGLHLFPRSDGVYPSNLNYCYVVVNPAQQSATVWYHRC
ncbi:hypothetical protein NESM_000257200 [Novymonas esmeraldas]|uniref:Cilia- and flagella-associated protein 300 n=1 Tax=Novymonas esmeraldas TaxID=1808958 RepID=A0AAW0FD77_9TRYP